MICYEFAEAFAPAILDGTKRQTMRRPEQRHTPDAHEKVALISGGRVLGIATVMRVRLVGLTIRPDGAAAVCFNGFFDADEYAIARAEGFEDAIARAEGFADAYEMGAWFAAHYRIERGQTRAFMLIEWALDERRS